MLPSSPSRASCGGDERRESACVTQFGGISHFLGQHHGEKPQLRCENGVWPQIGRGGSNKQNRSPVKIACALRFFRPVWGYPIGLVVLVISGGTSVVLYSKNVSAMGPCLL